MSKKNQFKEDKSSLDLFAMSVSLLQIKDTRYPSTCFVAFLSEAKKGGLPYKNADALGQAGMARLAVG